MAKTRCFTGIACTVTRARTARPAATWPAGDKAPIDASGTGINTDGIKTTSGDYNLTNSPSAWSEYRPPPRGPRRAPGRRAQEVGLPSATVANAETLVGLLRDQGASPRRWSAANTPPPSAPECIADFRAGSLAARDRCWRWPPASRAGRGLAVSCGFDPRKARLCCTLQALAAECASRTASTDCSG